MSGRRLLRRPPSRAAVAGRAPLTGCEGVYDLPLPGGAATGGDAYHVTVEFADVLDLVPQSAVKVNDVTVGAVEKVELDGWHARVGCGCADSVKLPDNADRRAAADQPARREVRLAVAAARTAAPRGRLGDGDMIPLSRTGRNPEVEEVLVRAVRCCSTAAAWPSSRRSTSS